MFVNRRRKPAEPLPMIDLNELSQRIGTAIVEIIPEPAAATAPESAAWTSVSDPAEPVLAARSELASLYDLHLFAVLGLPRFQAARDNGSRCAIVVLSVDTWSRYDAPLARDQHAPLEGVAKAIRQNIRANDIAARYGDDEFVIFLDRCDRLEAQRIVHRLSEHVFELRSSSGQLSLSAGIAVAPDSGAEMHLLIQRADGVLRDIRRTGRSEIRVVAPEWTAGVAMPSPA
jgi:diguanylate cyclase (GGDEF)-like protein